MPTPLHAALGRSGSELSFALVQEACDRRLTETDQLDWKRDLPLPTSGDHGVRERALELAKDIAAMANSRGGMLVYGVRDESTQASEVVGVGDLSDGEQARRIRQVAYNLIYPPVQINCHALVGGEQQVLIVEVAESEDAPHLVQPKRDGGNDGWLMAPYRSGPDTQTMVEKQIEAAYRQRLAGRRQRERRLRELIDELVVRWVAEADRTTGTLLAIAQPVRPRRGPLPARDPGRYAWTLLRSANALAQQLAQALAGPNHFPIALLNDVSAPRRAVRRHVFTASRQVRGKDRVPVGQPAEVVVEIHDDGTVGVGWRRGGAYSFTREPEEAPPTPGLATSDIDAFAFLILSLIDTIREDLDLRTDYQVRVEFAPHEPLYLVPDDGWAVGDYQSVPTPPPLEAELRLDAGPDTRAADFLAFGQDLSNTFEQSHTAIEAFWDLPRGTRPEHAVRQLARRLLGGEPDHPVIGRSMA